MSLPIRKKTRITNIDIRVLRKQLLEMLSEIRFGIDRLKQV